MTEYILSTPASSSTRTPTNSAASAEAVLPRLPRAPDPDVGLAEQLGAAAEPRAATAAVATVSRAVVVLHPRRARTGPARAVAVLPRLSQAPVLDVGRAKQLAVAAEPCAARLAVAAIPRAVVVLALAIAH